MHHAVLTETVNQTNQAATGAISGFSSMGMSQAQGLSSINRLIDQQAFTMAANDIFLGSALIFLLLIPIIWLSQPLKAPPYSGPAVAPPPDAASAH
jgi:DHA2 family multidrug resistance protein